MCRKSWLLLCACEPGESCTCGARAEVEARVDMERDERLARRPARIVRGGRCVREVDRG